MIRFRSALSVLCLGSDPAESARIRDRLEQGVYRVDWDVARSASDFMNALSPGLDVIVYQSGCSGIDVQEALTCVQSEGIDVPFIVAGGAYSDERALDLLSRGAADFVPYDRMALLQSSVERAIALRISRQRQHSMLQRLDELRSRFDAVVVAAPGVIYRFVRDALGRPRFTYLSDRFRTQFDLEPSVVLKDVWKLFERIHPDDRPSLFASIDASASSMQRWRWEGRVLVGNTYRWISGNSMPQQMDDGGVLWNGILSDITDRKRYETGLKNAVEHVKNVNSLKSSILTNLSHEIRTPLTGIIGFSELIEEGEISAAEVETFARLITESGKRLLATMDSVLDLAQIRGGVRQIELRSTDVVRHARSVVQSFDLRAQQKGLTLSVNASSVNCFAMADENMLQRVITGLVSNAIKFTDNGSVTVSVGLEGSEVVLRVEDTGIGISEESRGEIFDEFVQGSTGLNRSYDGIGLGLSITRELVIILGGILEFESEPRQGSTFMVRLPSVGQNAEPRHVDAPYSFAQSGADRRRLLVVEGNADNRTLFSRILAEKWDVAVAEDHSTGIEACRADRPDLIILDVELGDSVGAVRFLSRVQSLPSGASIPVIACSAYCETMDQARLREAGFADFLSKPFTKTELESAVFGCLSDHLSV